MTQKQLNLSQIPSEQSHKRRASDALRPHKSFPAKTLDSGQGRDPGCGERRTPTPGTLLLTLYVNTGEFVTRPLQIRPRHLDRGKRLPLRGLFEHNNSDLDFQLPCQSVNKLLLSFIPLLEDIDFNAEHNCKENNPKSIRTIGPGDKEAIATDWKAVLISMGPGGLFFTGP